MRSSFDYSSTIWLVDCSFQTSFAVRTKLLLLPSQLYIKVTPPRNSSALRQHGFQKSNCRRRSPLSPSCGRGRHRLRRCPLGAARLQARTHSRPLVGTLSQLLFFSHPLFIWVLIRLKSKPRFLILSIQLEFSRACSSVFESRLNFTSHFPWKTGNEWEIKRILPFKFCFFS